MIQSCKEACFVIADIKITISCLLTAACRYYHGVATLQSCCAVIQKSKGTLELLHYV